MTGLRRIPIFLLLLFAAACRRNDSPHITPRPIDHPNAFYDFTYYLFNAGSVSETIFPGDTVNFHVYKLFNVPDSFVLDFGDGSTSTDSICRHGYAHSGMYQVLLQQAGATISKYVQVVQGPDSTRFAHMGGSRIWHGTYNGVTAISDTFAITRLGRGHIILKGDTLTFNFANDTAAVPYYYFHGIYGPPYRGRDLTYYYLSDSLYMDYWFPTPGSRDPNDQSQIMLKTP